ncbi:MAG: SRPBCC family protein [Patescibacteria group bacterium]|nr:SRPBCC family protein [Patescibacteria group bacterium]MDD5716144.1 SRPBCC family protein [Patescibacteria group bacterium]
MKQIELKGSWILQAPKEKIYRIVSDFEKMPERFPKVAYSLKITKREGDTLYIDAKAKSFGMVIPVKMKTRLLPGRGYISENQNDTLGHTGHEELLLEEVPEGTKINYRYQLHIRNRFFAFIAKPLYDWYALKMWEKAFIDRLRELVKS